MKALSVCQPWAWAILHAGKSVENRTWRTRHRGPLLIHASSSRKWLKPKLLSNWQHAYGTPLPSIQELPFGAIIGQVELVDCVPIDAMEPGNAWAVGPWCWILANPVVTTPIPCKGRTLLFKVSDESIVL